MRGWLSLLLGLVLIVGWLAFCLRVKIVKDEREVLLLVAAVFAVFLLVTLLPLGVFFLVHGLAQVAAPFWK